MLPSLAFLASHSPGIAQNQLAILVSSILVSSGMKQHGCVLNFLHMLDEVAAAFCLEAFKVVLAPGCFAFLGPCRVIVVWVKVNKSWKSTPLVSTQTINELTEWIFRCCRRLGCSGYSPETHYNESGGRTEPYTIEQALRTRNRLSWIVVSFLLLHKCVVSTSAFHILTHIHWQNALKNDPSASIPIWCCWGLSLLRLFDRQIRTYCLWHLVWIASLAWNVSKWTNAFLKLKEEQTDSDWRVWRSLHPHANDDPTARR